MRRNIITSAATAAVAYACFFATPAPPVRSPAHHPAPPAGALPSPYDSIRTNLDDYAWPTDAGRIVTSTFGEFRRTHFHAGIDVSTGDRTGYRVMASRAGYVSLIRIDANGYGKMLLIRHPDGYSTLYAHLRGFADRIERRTRAEQLRLRRYPVEISCAPADFPLRKGELIAFTGETGSGSEHLHFEIRDENMNGVNPALAPRLRHPDQLPPRFLRLAAIPIGPGSRVDGEAQQRVVRVKEAGRRAFHLPRPIRITGAAGLAVFVRDHSDGSRFANGVYRHQLLVDGNPFFEIRLDRVPIDESQQISFAYSFELLDAGEGRFEKLFVDRLHTLPFYSDPERGAGVLSSNRISAGAHRFAVISHDISGNSAELTGTFVIDPPPAPAPPGDGTTADAIDRAGMANLIPGQRGSMSFDGGRLLLAWDTLAVYDTTSLRVRQRGDDEGVFYELTPRGGVLREPIVVAIRTDDTSAHQGIFHRTRSHWTFLRSSRRTDGRVTARVHRWIGDLRVLRDETPPEISPPRFFPHGRKGPVALVRFHDDLAGVDYQSVATYIDSTFVVPDIDGEHRRATVSAPEGLTRGSHRFTIRLSDHLGNTSFLERRFFVP